MIDVKSYSDYIHVRKEMVDPYSGNPKINIQIEAQRLDEVCNDYNSIRFDLHTMLKEWRSIKDSIERYPAVAQAWKDFQTIKNLCEEK